MYEHLDDLPADVRAALARGETIEAIKRLRLGTKLGLKEAKDVIDALVAGRPPPRPLPAAAPAPPYLPADGTLPAEVLVVLAADGKIAAIKLLRERTGLGLKEAKDAIDAAPAPPRAPAHAATPASPATKTPARTPTIVAEASTRGMTIALVVLAVALVAGVVWLLQR